MDFTRLTVEQEQSFHSNGFLVVRNALDAQTVDRLIKVGDRLGEVFLKKYEVLNKPWYNDLDLRPGLLEHDALLALVAHSTTVPLVVQLLSPNIHLLSTSIIYKRPENPDFPLFRRGWHRDLRMPEDMGHENMPRVGIKICYCLTEFRPPDSGMTLMARNTQRRNEPLVVPRGEVDPLDVEVCDLELSAGDALLFENGIFHTATPNRSDHVAKRIIYGYAYRWMKQEVYLESPGKQLLKRADRITRQLMGAYRDIDTPPWALRDWARSHGICPPPVAWTVEG